MQLRAVSTNTPMQALKERLGGGSFLLGRDAKSPGFASHIKQLHHLGFFSFLAKTFLGAFYYSRGTGSSSVLQPAVFPENSLGFIFEAQQLLLPCWGKAEAAQPHTGALQRSLRSSPFQRLGATMSQRSG